MSPPVGVDRDIPIGADSVFERISPEEIWACTSCKACDEICPVNIEILDKILDMRRYLTLMESDFPTELGNTFRSMENSGNAYGLNQGDRGDWASTLEGVDIVEPGGAFDHEYLYFVGCAGSFDDRNKKTSRALAKLLQRAGIDFAILGPSEMCNGDQARRVGQRVHLPDARDAERRDVRLHGREEDHHAVPALLQRDEERLPAARRQLRGDPPLQLLDELVRDGRLSLAGATLEERVTYHDSCYLGRHNDVYLAPRRVVGSLAGIDLVEMPRNGTQGHVLRRRRRAHVDGGEHRQEGEHRTQPGSDRDRRVAHRGRVPLLLRDVRRRREGRRQGRRGPRAGHRRDPLGSDRERRSRRTRPGGTFTPGI